MTVNPTGKPSPVNPAGTDRAGTPAAEIMEHDRIHPR